MDDDDLRFGDQGGGGGQSSGLVERMVEIFVAIIIGWVMLRIIDLIIFDGAIPFI